MYKKNKKKRSVIQKLINSEIQGIEWISEYNSGKSFPQIKIVSLFTYPETYKSQRHFLLPMNTKRNIFEKYPGRTWILKEISRTTVLRSVI